MDTLLSEAVLVQKYLDFPQELKIAVSSYIELLEKNYKSFTDKAPTPTKKRQFGIAKGMYKMSPDFDEPLEDFIS